MDTSKYILVEWSAEQKYSVVKREAIVDTRLKTQPDEEIIGKILKVNFGKNKAYDAVIIQCGNKTNMTYELDILVKQQKGPLPQPRVLQASSTQENIAEVLGRLEDLTENDDDGADGSIMLEKLNKLEAELESEKTRTAKYKNKFKNLKRKYNDLVDQTNQTQVSELGDGVFLPKTQLDTILSLSDTPEKLARNLMRALFEEEEMLGHSLFGLKCNANHLLPVRPSIDAKRRDAIIHYTLQKYGSDKQPGDAKKKNSTLALLHRTMGDLLRSMTRKQLKQTN